eukprot:7377043-Prymnesium_polylepis.1
MARLFDANAGLASRFPREARRASRRASRVRPAALPAALPATPRRQRRRSDGEGAHDAHLIALPPAARAPKRGDSQLGAPPSQRSARTRPRVARRQVPLPRLHRGRAAADRAAAARGGGLHATRRNCARRAARARHAHRSRGAVRQRALCREQGRGCHQRAEHAPALRRAWRGGRSVARGHTLAVRAGGGRL